MASFYFGSHKCQGYSFIVAKYKCFLCSVPSIMLASFAMQESSCNPNTVGGGGEQGLMQISPDKCDGAPGGDCKNAVSDIQIGSLYKHVLMYFLFSF